MSYIDLNWPKQLQEHNAKFERTGDLNQQKKEVFDLVLKNPNAVEFDLMMVIKAHYYESYDFYAPEPTKYLSEIDATDIIKFFSSIRDIGSFVSDLQDVAKKLTSKKRVKDESTHIMDLAKRGCNPDKFFQLLHFFLLTNPLHLKEMDAPWYNEIPCQNVQVFYCTYTAAEERNFPKRGRWNAFLFHGTSEWFVYSIMRNGIKKGFCRGVFMSSDVNIAVQYCKSRNTVLFCFEVRFDCKKEKMPCSLQKCCFEPASLVLRAIIWISWESRDLVQMVADKVKTELEENLYG